MRGQAGVAPVVHDVLGNAAQIVDQRQPQHDRNRPQLAELERRHLLVGGDETAQRDRIHAPVAMRHHLQAQLVDARQAHRRWRAQTR